MAAFPSSSCHNMKRVDWTDRVQLCDNVTQIEPYCLFGGHCGIMYLEAEISAWKTAISGTIRCKTWFTGNKPAMFLTFSSIAVQGADPETGSLLAVVDILTSVWAVSSAELSWHTVPCIWF